MEISKIYFEDSIKDAEDKVKDIDLAIIPVWSGKKVVGLIDRALIQKASEKKKISDLNLTKPIIISETTSFHDRWVKIIEQCQEILIIQDKRTELHAILSKKELINQLKKEFNLKEEGSIIVLQMRKLDYVPSQIAKICEDEEASIQLMFYTLCENLDDILVTIHVNQEDIHSLINALERHDYLVHDVISNNSTFSELKERYDTLMHYLNV